MNCCDRSIGWADWTWNPVTGCLNGCFYCYGRRIAQRFAGTPAFPNGFAPTWHPERVLEPMRLKKASRIFLGSMTDMFGVWVTAEQMLSVLATVSLCEQHTFYILTKRPERVLPVLGELCIGPERFRNLWLGATVDTWSAAESTGQSMSVVRSAGWRTFVSVEPLLERILPDWLDWAEWFIVGALTGPGSKAHRPERDWVTRLVDYCAARRTPIYVKRSLAHVSDRQEWPV
jgi:protein gp37